MRHDFPPGLFSCQFQIFYMVACLLSPALKQRPSEVPSVLVAGLPEAMTLVWHMKARDCLYEPAA